LEAFKAWEKSENKLVYWTPIIVLKAWITYLHNLEFSKVRVEDKLFSVDKLFSNLYPAGKLISVINI
jgi:hypothetical protein